MRFVILVFALELCGCATAASRPPPAVNGLLRRGSVWNGQAEKLIVQTDLRVPVAASSSTLAAASSVMWMGGSAGLLAFVAIAPFLIAADAARVEADPRSVQRAAAVVSSCQMADPGFALSDAVAKGMAAYLGYELATAPPAGAPYMRLAVDSWFGLTTDGANLESRGLDSYDSATVRGAYDLRAAVALLDPSGRILFLAHCHASGDDRTRGESIADCATTVRHADDLALRCAADVLRTLAEAEVAPAVIQPGQIAKLDRRSCASFTSAVLPGGTVLLTSPDPNSRILVTLHARTPACVRPESTGYGFHRTVLENGTEGFVADADVP